MPSRFIVVLVSLLLATPAVLFWLSLVMEPAKLCPAECMCVAEEYHVKCYGPSLPAVPLSRLTGLQYLWLYYIKIKFLERDSFASLTELKGLNVEWSSLRTIELGAFNGLTELIQLTIKGNEISEIIPGTFENMINLNYLNLEKNRLEHLDSGVFSGLVNIETIDLTANKLQYLHPDTFLGLQNLQYMYLRSNPGLQIPTYRNFINSPSLLRLDISYCNVSSVSVETFANVIALEWLDLRFNNLRIIDINIFRTLTKLSTLYLYGNRLHCDCQLKEVWRWYKDRNIETYYVECDTPSEVKGMWWEVLEKGHCLLGNIQYYGDYKSTTYSYNDIDDTYTRTETDKYNNTEMETYTRTETDTYNDTETDRYKYTQTDTYEYNDTETDRYKYTQTDTYEYNDTETDKYNNTENKNPHTYIPMFELLSKYQVQLFVVPFIFGTTGNVILLIIIICNKDMRTVPNMYIINLAISDIIYLTVLFSEACENKMLDTWLDGGFICTFLPFCRRLSVVLSAYSVAVLSVQRYRVTVNPFHARVSSQRTWRATVVTICGVWIVAALFAVPSALSKYLCREVIFFGRKTYYQRVVIFELLVSCVLPLCVIAFSYIMTARHLLKTSHSIFEGTQNPQLETRRNTAKIVVGLTFVFLISYVPYHALWTYFVFTAYESITYIPLYFSLASYNSKVHYTYQISTCFLLMNSCLNPVALFCTSSPFRQNLKRYLTCFRKTNSPPRALELTRQN